MPGSRMTVRVDFSSCGTAASRATAGTEECCRGNDGSWMNRELANRRGRSRDRTGPGMPRGRLGGGPLRRWATPWRRCESRRTFFVLLYHAVAGLPGDADAPDALGRPRTATATSRSIISSTGSTASRCRCSSSSAGISAPAACESRGPRVFLTRRGCALLRPLLFGCLTDPAVHLSGLGLRPDGDRRLRPGEHPEVAVQPRGDPSPVRPGALLVPRISLPGLRPLVRRLVASQLPVRRAERRPRGRRRGLGERPSPRPGGRSARDPDGPDLPRRLGHDAPRRQRDHPQRLPVAPLRATSSPRGAGSRRPATPGAVHPLQHALPGPVVRRVRRDVPPAAPHAAAPLEGGEPDRVTACWPPCSPG